MPPVETARVAPPMRSAAPWPLVSARPDDDLCLHVVFVDGTAGVVQLRAFIESPAAGGTLFEPLRDPAYFRLVPVELGAMTWPNGADLREEGWKRSARMMSRPAASAVPRAKRRAR